MTYLATGGIISIRESGLTFFALAEDYCAQLRLEAARSRPARLVLEVAELKMQALRLAVQSGDEEQFARITHSLPAGARANDYDGFYFEDHPTLVKVHDDLVHARAVFLIDLDPSL